MLTETVIQSDAIRQLAIQRTSYMHH